MAKLDTFLEKEKYKNFKYYIQQNTVKSNEINKALDNSGEKTTNKAGDIETQERFIEDIKRMADSKRQMTGMVNPVISESTLPIQVIYNSKIERIRILEFETEKAPQPVKFDISDAYSGLDY